MAGSGVCCFGTGAVFAGFWQRQPPYAALGWTVNTPLFNNRADWISPGYDDTIFKDGPPPMMPGSPPSQWFANPSANDGAKVMLSDTDHYSPMQANALWAWKSFVRGHQPPLYDLGIISGVNPLDPNASMGAPSYASLEPARWAMGDTLRYAQKMQLIAMQPRGELSSTGYALANLGEEYLVLQPCETTEPFTVKLPAGTYNVEWFSVNDHETKAGDPVMVKRARNQRFIAPFTQAGPAVAYLKRIR